MRYLSVILPVPLRQTFTYHLEDDLVVVSSGCRVVVTFGGRKYMTGVVAEISNVAPADIETRSIDSVLDVEPIVSEKQLKLWQWMAQYYMCSIGEVMKAALPSGLRIENKTFVSPNPDFVSDTNLKGAEAAIYNYLLDEKTEEISKLAKHVSVKNIAPVIKRLVDKNAVMLQDDVKQKFKPKLRTYFKLSEDLKDEVCLENAFIEIARAKKQVHLLNKIIDVTEGGLYDADKILFFKQNEVSVSAYNQFKQKGFIEEFAKEVSRIEAENMQVKELNPLSDAQQKAFDDTKTAFANKKTVLLHGVTASGKTEVYIHLIKEQLDAGKQVLFLLPEIAITVEMLRRLVRIFGDKVSVYHSRYNDTERVEVWNKINAANEGRIVLGARSAVFLPFKNLGLIVVDEEHEESYKQQEPAPNYHARDTAIMLAHYLGANVILGSATPSMESSYNAQKGKYALATLLQRYSQVALPIIVPIDMAEAYKKGRHRNHFSFELIDQIKETLTQKEKVILFQNRRGYSGFVECKACGHVPQCPNCDISLTYHLYRKKLTCHYCGFEQEMPDNCPQCGSAEFNSKGLGTEKVAEQATALFPGVIIERFDQDTTRSKGNFDKIINRFNDGDTDILVGTQMIAKGLDFDNVGLVAIMNADNMMNFPDYRAHEKAYQLMSQVAGRSGRRSKQGKVILQSYTPDYNLIRSVVSYDFASFYNQQIEERKEFNYPPFVKIVEITAKHFDFQKTQQAAQLLADKLRERFGFFVLGPEAPPVGRIKLQYHQRIMLKVLPQYPLQATKDWIISIAEAIMAMDDFKAVKFVFEVDK